MNHAQAYQQSTGEILLEFQRSTREIPLEFTKGNQQSTREIPLKFQGNRRSTREIPPELLKVASSPQGKFRWRSFNLKTKSFTVHGGNVFVHEIRISNAPIPRVFSPDSSLRS